MKNIILLALLSLCLTNGYSQNKDFIYENGNDKIVFEILNNSEYLVEGTVNRTKFSFENIDPKKVLLSGKTIRYMAEQGIKGNEIIIHMSPKREDLENGKLKVWLTYTKDEELKKFEILIPVKSE